MKQKSKKDKLRARVWHEEFVSEVYNALSNITPRSARDIQKIFNNKEDYPKPVDAISAINTVLNNDLKDKTIRVGNKYLRRKINELE